MVWPLPMEAGMPARVLVPDLGTDAVWQLSATGEKQVIYRGPAGDGPRHLARLGNDCWLLLNELSGVLSVLAFDRAGSLSETQRLPLADRPELGNPAAAAIKVLPHAGRPGHTLVFASLRGRYNEIVSLRLIPGPPSVGSRLEIIGRASLGHRGPRDFALSRDGRWLLVASQHDNLVECLALDAASGRVADSGRRIACPSPVSLLAVD